MPRKIGIIYVMKVCFETFGCRLNRAEALEEEAKYEALGYDITSSHKEADVIVVRGCSVTRRAQHDSEALIAHLKEKYPFTKIVVQGCLKDAEKSVSETLATPTRTSRAYLKVQDGCSGKCTFCIVPTFRGKSVSENFTSVLDKAKRFIDAGYHEIVVTGCNLSLFASEGKRLPELLASLADLSPDCRIRLGSLEPWLGAKETIDVIAEKPNLCKFVHLPIQSGSNRILSAMKRPYQVREVEDILRYVVDKLPGCSLGSDMITGFPDETELDFIESYGLLKRFPFNNAHVFPYSERPGTLAVALPNPVSKDLRSKRAHSLTELVRFERERFANKHLGHEVEIVIEGEKHFGGWTSDYLWCDILNLTKHKRKELVKVRVLEVHHDKLAGFVIENS